MIASPPGACRTGSQVDAAQGRGRGVGYNCPDFPPPGWRMSPTPPECRRPATSPPVKLHAGSAETRRASRFFEAFRRALVSRRRGRGAGRDGRERHGQDHAAAHARRARRRPTPAKSGGKASASGPSIPSSGRRSPSAGTCPRSRTSSRPRRISPRSWRSKDRRPRARPCATRSTTSRLSRQRVASRARAFAGPAPAHRARAPLARLAPAVDPGRAAGRARRRRRRAADAHPRPPSRERRTRRRGNARAARPPRVARRRRSRWIDGDVPPPSPSPRSAPTRAWPAIRWAVARDLKLALRSRAELGVQLLFYVIVASLFPLATTPERTHARPHRTGRAVGGGVARLAPVAAAALRRRLRRRHARADRAVALPARGARLAARSSRTG